MKSESQLETTRNITGNCEIISRQQTLPRFASSSIPILAQHSPTSYVAPNYPNVRKQMTRVSLMEPFAWQKKRKSATVPRALRPIPVELLGTKQMFTN